MSHSATRVFGLLALLQAYPGLTGPELARRLGVDTRTVRRYAERLAEFGVPVVATRGRHGGYRLLPGYKLPPLMFTDGEAVAVVLGLIAARRLALSTMDGDAAAALAKIRRVLPAALGERTLALESALDFTLTAPSSAAPDSSVLLALSEAVARNRRVRLSYRSWRGGESERDLDPYGIVFHSGRWYVTGHDGRSGQTRTFRLDRVIGVEPGERVFAPPAHFDPVAHIEASLAKAPYRWPVEVLLDTTMDTARERIPRTVGELSETGAGVLMRARAENLDGMARMLAGLGLPFTVREPDELRTAVAELAARLGRYAATGTTARAPAPGTATT